MESKKSINNFKEWFSSNFIIQKHLKNELADQNLKRLFIIDWIILIYIIILFVNTNSYTQYTENSFLKIYHIGYLVSNIVSLILTYAFRKNTKLNPGIRNFPVYFTFILMMIFSIFILLEYGSIINLILIFVYISIIVPLFFTVAPIIYIPIVIITYFFIIFEVKNETQLNTIMNLGIFVLIMSFLSIFKWHSTKTSMMLKKEQEEHTKLLEKEINLAAYVQNSFYKHIDLHLEGWNIEYYSQPMAGVSGDMFDIYFHDNTLDGLGIFDVSGHGISSGLVTMLVKNIIQQEFDLGKNEKLPIVMKNLNDRIIVEKGEIENFLTGILGRIHNDTLEFINAGNPQPLVHIQESNTCYYFENNESNNYGVIGMSDFPVSYSVNTLEMKSGDSILFYTDGITENCDEFNHPYGQKNLMQVFKSNTYKTSKDQLADIISDFKKFKGDTHSTDDITLLLLKKL